MKCKQGDMAVITQSAADNEGRVVTCMEFVGDPGIVKCGGFKILMNGDDYWRVDIKLNVVNPMRYLPDTVPLVRDCCLMPISGYKEPQQVKEEEGEPA